MDKITKARAALVLAQPFFGSLALHLKPCSDTGIETMSTDGESLFANPDFVDTLSFDELTGVIAHEVMHLACGHHARRGDRQPRRWNIACDYAINGMLFDAGFVLPESGLHNPHFDGLPAEEIYARLVQDSEGDGGSHDPPASGQDPGGCGSVRDAPGQNGAQASPADLVAAARDWQVAALQAAQTAKAAGKLPGSVARLVEHIRKPAVDWRAVLRRFIQTTARNDYRWFPPNRRYVALGLYLPSLRSDALGPVVIAVDTSGSISAEIVAAFSAEISAIVEDCQPEAVHVLYCNTAITGIETYTPEDLPLDLKPRGGGGTDFRPPFAWVEEQGVAPACFVYLTDLCCRRFPTLPAYPVLWASTTDRTGPFGETVQLRPV